ncbi:MAG TPA: class C beta-lactamase [Noviherbaspirillum sp.]|jgi:CubicO group peptidase (beta-lactamase class C family)|uniref:class C beta-lactamase n=1 Tax=Noviherbaspirillum sp. TaxID=1926288 RepID=UPI002DDD72EE|nr:class C beta-lactamase [Noviherbaspirillum sp.]HEV2610179.1 class C beta-lactamase [Noviherbaspirillum sp.]
MRLLKLCAGIGFFLATSAYASGDVDYTKLQQTVDDAIRPAMQKYDVPGMAVALTVNGKRHFYNYGIASKETKRPVTTKTLFEIGSISKTFTATLASYAHVNGSIDLSDSPGRHLPALRGSRFDESTLLDLGTYTPGGLPLQVPDGIDNNEQLINYLKAWQPAYQPGSQRMYSNVSIGMLGMIAAKSMQTAFDSAVERTIFRPLGMNNSYFHVPANKMGDYAQGYSKSDQPIRMRPGVLALEAYAVKSNALDMIRFIEANMRVSNIDATLQRAIDHAHIGYFKSGELVQSLVWEQYPYPTELKQLLAGNGNAMVFEANKVIRFHPPLPPQSEVLINKTGSTNGFAAYVAYIPAQKLGIVMLANKNYPADARVTAAYQILTSLAKGDVMP